MNFENQTILMVCTHFFKNILFTVLTFVKKLFVLKCFQKYLATVVCLSVLDLFQKYLFVFVA
jgi:uncharacterized protein YebE (UPF0316 family)